MSENNYALEISDKAYDDLVNIQNYTYAQYGEDKWVEYGSDLDKAMGYIMHNPHSRHGRKDIPSGYLAWSVNEHIMIYRVEGRVIYLVRVLHSKMDFRFQFAG